MCVKSPPWASDDKVGLRDSVAFPVPSGKTSLVILAVMATKGTSMVRGSTTCWGVGAVAVGEGNCLLSLLVWLSRSILLDYSVIKNAAQDGPCLIRSLRILLMRHNRLEVPYKRDTLSHNTRC